MRVLALHQQHCAQSTLSVLLNGKKHVIILNTSLTPSLISNENSDSANHHRAMSCS